MTWINGSDATTEKEKQETRSIENQLGSLKNSIDKQKASETKGGKPMTEMNAVLTEDRDSIVANVGIFTPVCINRMTKTVVSAREAKRQTDINKMTTPKWQPVIKKVIEREKTDPKPRTTNRQRDRSNPIDKRHTDRPTSLMVNRPTATGVPVYVRQSKKTQKEAHPGNTVCSNVFNKHKSIKWFELILHENGKKRSDQLVRWDVICLTKGEAKALAKGKRGNTKKLSIRSHQRRRKKVSLLLQNRQRTVRMVAGV